MSKELLSNDLQTLHWHKRKPVLRIELDFEAAEWIANSLPQNDAATRDLWREIARAESLTALEKTP